MCQLPWSELNQEKKHPPFALIPSSSQDPSTCSEPCVESLALISPLFLRGPACKSVLSAESFMGVSANCHPGQTLLTPARPPTPPSPPLYPSHISITLSFSALTDIHSDGQMHGDIMGFNQLFQQQKEAKGGERGGNHFSVLILHSHSAALCAQCLTAAFFYFFFLAVSVDAKMLHLSKTHTCAQNNTLG